MITASIVIYKTKYSELSKVINCVENSNVNIIYIVDNSPTNDLEVVRELSSKIIYIFNDANIGFGAGHNIAIEKAFEVNSKYHIVINPDIYFENGTIEKLVEFMDTNEDVGLIMPKVLYPDGRVQYLCKLLPTPSDWIFRRFLPFKSLLKRKNDKFELRFSNYDKMMNIPYLSGCFMFFRVDVLREIGLFDTGIFMYGEDTDITRRIYQKYKSIFYPEVIIYHEHQKESHKFNKLLWIHIKAAVYYFNKWGWFFDKERRQINKRVLSELGYNKKDK
jgi:GT2 family glycosyltransferase